ncbi:MAG: hypothetical protein ABIF77_04495 [bacterium]
MNESVVRIAGRPVTLPNRTPPARKCTREVHSLLLLALILAAIPLISGCQPQTDLQGTAIPNAPPTTRLTAMPPTDVEAGFVVHFYWTGSDPDGEVAGYQWKLCTIGDDGFDVQDSLTVDPATGEQLNPWRYTTNQDTTLIVSAELPGYPEDEELEPEDRRAYQAHVLFIRAVDNDGEPDPTPDMIGFTATTLLPRIWVDRPSRLSSYLDAQRMPPTVNFGFTGRDPDFETEMPTMYRYLWKKAWLPNWGYIRTGVVYYHVYPQLLDFDDPAWSDWLPYSEDPEQRVITIPDQLAIDENGEQIAYLFAVQAMDIAGAVSMDLTYGRSVHNVYINPNMAPTLTVYEPLLGFQEVTGNSRRTQFDVMSGQLVDFQWRATAEDYLGRIVGYRYGWDVHDPEDQADPNWAVEPGLSPEHLRAPTRSIPLGRHTLTIQARDDLGQFTRMVYLLNMIHSDIEPSKPLLLVDDVADKSSYAWPSLDSLMPLDNDIYRDAFWEELLTGPGGVSMFNSSVDVVDLEEETLFLHDLIRYRAIIWTTRWSQNNGVWDMFKPQSHYGYPYVWLQAYQQNYGNLMLVGSRAARSFLPERHWLSPIHFDSNLSFAPDWSGNWPDPGPWLGPDLTELPDGTSVRTGTLRYPYRGLGISLLDAVTPYGPDQIRGCNPSQYPQCWRRVACTGVKGLTVDAVFQAQHGGALPFPETILTETSIDWRDEIPGHRDNLCGYWWGGDEMYDGNISNEPVNWTPQLCDGQPCLEPMFRIYSRFDWVDDLQEAAGNPDWPATHFATQSDLELVCGGMALDPATGRTRTSGQITGFISHTFTNQAPSRRGNVVWGFDPYRFEHEQMGAAIRWVLGKHFDLLMND